MQGRLASGADTVPQELTNCRGAIWRPPHEAEIADRNNLLLQKGCPEMLVEAPVASHGGLRDSRRRSAAWKLGSAGDKPIPADADNAGLPSTTTMSGIVPIASRPRTAQLAARSRSDATRAIFRDLALAAQLPVFGELRIAFALPHRDEGSNRPNDAAAVRGLSARSDGVALCRSLQSCRPS